MRFSIKTFALVAILALNAVASVQATPNLTGYPNSMAATGDSITRAYNTGSLPFSDAPGNSWSTGTRASVESHYARILVAQPAILGRNYNQAVSGARMSGLPAQMQQVNDRGVAYVTILIGANDMCTRTVAGMTSVADFRSQFERAMAALSAGSPRARIYVVSIPDVFRLWVIFKDNLLARVAWRTLDICQSLLERPRSTELLDVRRRMTVRQRNIDFNTQLAAVCATYIHCRFDQNAVFSDRFQPEDVSRRDYFHPSLQGQRRLARVAWSATFDFSDQIPPVTTASTTVVEGGSLVSLEATDDVGVAGIEYRLNLGAFQRYTGPFVLTAGSNIRFRAVDVNGNIEATQSLTG
jgi:lysophospholipase L1-like esterase